MSIVCTSINVSPRFVWIPWRYHIIIQNQDNEGIVSALKMMEPRRNTQTSFVSSIGLLHRCRFPFLFWFWLGFHPWTFRFITPFVSVQAFSEHLEAAEEEHQFDDRTLLDMFGEGAKEFLTKQVVSVCQRSRALSFHSENVSFTGLLCLLLESFQTI